MRPSGTLQSPTTGSLEAMIREADRDEQIAAARMLPKNPVVQLPDAPIPTAAKPAVTDATNTLATKPAVTDATNTQAAKPAVTDATNTQATNTAPTATAPLAATPPANNLVATQNKPVAIPEELPAFVPAPKSLVSDRAASQVAAVNSSAAGSQNAVLTSLPKPTAGSLNTPSGTTRVARISFLPAEDELKIGEKRRYAVQLNSDVSLSLALLALRFDPRVVRINAVSAGSLLSESTNAAPALTQSVDPLGVCLISISAINGRNQLKGIGSLIFIDVEAIGPGNASFVFDKDALHLVATDARDVTSQITQGNAIVKQ
jgi:hypothetical protein